MKKFLNRNISFISIIILITVWQVCGNLGLLPKFIFPTPLEIANAFVRDRALFLFHFKITMLEALIGLALGIFFACLLAIIMDSFEMINKIIYPLLIFTQTIPTIALAPILVLWLGYDMTPKIVLIVINTTFPIIISILDGFRHCDKDAIQLLKLMNASKWQILYHLKIPTALTYFYAGLRVSVSYAFISAVEGIEGTDETLKRAGQYSDKDNILIKMARPQQDMRVDVPVIGLDTVETAIQNGFKGIVAQAKKMIFLNQKECIELANKNNIFIIAKKI